MFVVYMLMFLAGFYLFGLAFTITSMQGLVFVLGLLLVSGALALCLHLPAAKERHDG